MFLRCRNMGSTLSAPWAYLQKHGCPWIGIPASLDILRSWSVKFLHQDRKHKSIPEQILPPTYTVAAGTLQHRVEKEPIPFPLLWLTCGFHRNQHTQERWKKERVPHPSPALSMLRGKVQNGWNKPLLAEWLQSSKGLLACTASNSL